VALFSAGVCQALALGSGIVRRRTNNSTRTGRVKWCMDNQTAPSKGAAPVAAL